MWNIVLKVNRKVIGTADTFRDAVRAMVEATKAGFEADVVKAEVK